MIGSTSQALYLSPSGKHVPSRPLIRSAAVANVQQRGAAPHRHRPLLLAHARWLVPCRGGSPFELAPHDADRRCCKHRDCQCWSSTATAKASRARRCQQYMEASSKRLKQDAAHHHRDATSITPQSPSWSHHGDEEQQQQEEELHGIEPVSQPGKFQSGPKEVEETVFPSR